MLVGALNKEKENMSKWMSKLKNSGRSKCINVSWQEFKRSASGHHAPAVVVYVHLKPKFCTALEKYLDIAR